MLLYRSIHCKVGIYVLESTTFYPSPNPSTAANESIQPPQFTSEGATTYLCRGSHANTSVQV
jgi:hypothetical protein